MTTLLEIALRLKEARVEAGLSQQDLASRAKVNRQTVGRMEKVTHGDMSVSVLLRLLAAAGYDLKIVKAGHIRTLDDILAEQRSGDFP